MVLKQIKNDLEDSGYKVLPPIILPACGKDAGHKRERIWIVAYLNSHGFNRQCQEIQPTAEQFKAFGESTSSLAAHTNGIGIQGKLQKKIYRVKGTERRQTQQQLTDGFQLADTFEPKLCRTLHGIPFGVDRIKSLGNAIVPQVAFEIFKAIEDLTLR
jgi:DNA (cytosine-5)-methyltransferase 1